MDEFEVETIAPRSFRLIDLAVIGAGFVADVAGAVESATDMLVQLTAQHANYLRDRENMHEQAALEIEMLTKGIE